jgi:hypothetical protein
MVYLLAQLRKMRLCLAPPYLQELLLAHSLLHSVLQSQKAPLLLAPLPLVR